MIILGRSKKAKQGGVENSQEYFLARSTTVEEQGERSKRKEPQY